MAGVAVTSTAETMIIINATMDNAASFIGGVLSNMGYNLSAMSGPIGKAWQESAETFKNYQISMRDAEAALSRQHQDGAELAAVMDDLDTQARQWAATTIFHTNDIADAVALAAHADYSYQDIKGRMPAAMRLAQAGSIPLSEALNMLIKSSYAMEIPAEDADDFVDMWVYAANSSATTVEEIGKAMLTLGPTMRWADGPAEMLTLIASIANVGTTGQQAANLLNNPIMRLLTIRSEKQGMAFDKLQLTEQEKYNLSLPLLIERFGDEETYLNSFLSWMNNDEKSRAYIYWAKQGKEWLLNGEQDRWFYWLDREDQGKLRGYWNAYLRNMLFFIDPKFENHLKFLRTMNFSRYGADGKILPLTYIMEQMNDALIRITGEEDYTNHRKALTILGWAFPRRAIQGATGLLTAAANDWDGLYEALLSGRSHGYAQYVADTMMDTLYGSMEIMESRMENLRLAIGERIAPDAQAALEGIGQVMVSVSEMDGATLDGMIRSAEILAASSTVILLTGGAMRLAGLLTSPMGLAGLSLLAATAGAAAMQALDEAEYAGQFGEMRLEKATYTRFVEGIGNDFEQAYANVETFRRALDGAVNSYTSASGSLASSLFTALSTGKTLTSGEQAALMSLGEDMYKALMDALTFGTSASLSFWETFFGGEAEASQSSAYQEIVTKSNEAYQDALQEAASIGQRFRDKLGAALSNDGQISPEEYQELLDEMRVYNLAMARASAEAQKEEDYIAMSSILHKAQTADYDELVLLTEQTEAARANAISHAEERYLSEYYRLERMGISERTLTETVAVFELEKEALNRQYDEYLTRMWLSQIEQSEQGGAYRNLRGIAQRWVQGLITGAEAERSISVDMGKSAWVDGTSLDADTNRSQLGRMLGSWLFYMGGPEAVARQISYAEATGDTAWAATLREAFAMAQLVNRFSLVSVADGVLGTGFGAGFISDGAGLWEDLTRETLGLPGEDISLSELRITIGRGNTYRYLSTVYAKWKSGELRLPSPDNGPATQDELTFRALYEDVTSVVDMVADSYDLQKVLDDLEMDSGDAEIDRLLAVWALLYGGQEIHNQLQPESYRLQPETKTKPRETGANSRESFTAMIRGAIPTATVELHLENTLPMAAAGGRADGPAVFGEAGPEWAIPEEHTDRTAALLNAARAASGFTWEELLRRFGGGQRRLVYRPHFDVADAQELRQALREDKQRLLRWLAQPEGETYA